MRGQEASQVRFGQTVIEYQVRRSPRRKTVSIFVKPRFGVLVVAPSGLPLTRLDSVVHGKARWIVDRLRTSWRGEAPPQPREFVSGESYLYLGRHYRLKISPQAETSDAKLVGGWIQVPLRKALRAKERSAVVRTVLESWYRAHASLKLPERVRRIAPKLGVAPPKIAIREQQRRWGSCDISGVLRFNWRIIQAPMRLVDYVVAHELVHLVEKNHTTTFWSVLGKAMPDYDRRREELARLGPSLVW